MINLENLHNLWWQTEKNLCGKFILSFCRKCCWYNQKEKNHFKLTLQTNTCQIFRFIKISSESINQYSFVVLGSKIWQKYNFRWQTNKPSVSCGQFINHNSQDNIDARIFHPAQAIGSRNWGDKKIIFSQSFNSWKMNDICYFLFINHQLSRPRSIES